MNLTTTLAILTAALGATTADAAPKKLPPVRAVPFYAEAERGEHVNILRHGPLTLRLRCNLDEGATHLSAELLVRSDEPEARITEHAGALMNDGPSAFHSLFLAEIPNSGLNEGAYVAADATGFGTTHFIDFHGVDGSVLTPRGWLLSVPADSVAFGIRLNGRLANPTEGPDDDHAWSDGLDCLVRGVALLTRVPTD
jgi:hypothetical protein